MKKLLPILLLFAMASTIFGCKPDDIDDGTKNDHGWVYKPDVYVLEIPRNFPDEVNLPANNPLTVQGVKLGRMLFYDPILSGDSTLACAGCHKQENAFADSRTFSIGIDGLPGKRHSMPLFNLMYSNKFFWDGRAATLAEQALMPVEDPLEMHENWPNNISKLQAHQDYPKLFYEAFGVEPADLTKEHTAKALEQFMLTLVSASSRFDEAITGFEELTDSEYRGFELFKDQNGADCIHCHGEGGVNQIFHDLKADQQFQNNGLENAPTAADYTDPGLSGHTGNPLDIGKFKVPSLRNLAFTAPYMHDGRFATLDDVIEFYSTGVHQSYNVSPGMEYAHQNGVQLSAQEKADLKAFLLSLTDDEFVTDPRFSNPFE